MECPRCGRAGPNGLFCTWCGRRQGLTGAGTDRYAVNPVEAVLHLSVVGTLMPHISHRRAHDFRLALLVGLLVLLLLYAVGLIVAAILASAVLLPVLFVLYLFEVRTYHNQPVTAIAITMGGGFVLGLVATLALDAVAGSAIVSRESPLGSVIDLGALFIGGFAIPLVQEILKPIPAFIARQAGRFTESLDGVVLGVSAAIGFAAAETIIHFSPVIESTPIQTEPANWAYPLITIAILMPLLHGSTTGVLVGSLWRFADHSLAGLRWIGVGSAFLAHAGFVTGSNLLQAAAAEPIVVLAWQSIVVAAELMLLRVVLDRAVHAEAAEFGPADQTCGHCGWAGQASAFCPSCGRAIAASAHRAGAACPGFV